MCSFLILFFCNETQADFEPVQDRVCFKNSVPILAMEEDVLSRLNKSAGPDLIHTRVIHEIRHDIAHPLTMLFNRYLETKQIP